VEDLKEAGAKGPRLLGISPLPRIGYLTSKLPLAGGGGRGGGYFSNLLTTDD